MPVVPNGPGAPQLAGADRVAAVAAVKQVLRASIGDDDALMAALAETGLGLAEQFTGQVLLRRAMTVPMMAGTRWWLIPAAPVVAVTDVVMVGVDDGETPLPAGSWAADIDGDGRAFLRVDASRRVRVSLTAGLATGWAELPAAIAEGVALLAAHLFEGRADAAPPMAITALWRPYRALRLGGEVRA